MSTQGGPSLPPAKPWAKRTKALADLRQAVWEATQWLTAVEVLEYVGGVLDEVESEQT